MSNYKPVSLGDIKRYLQLLFNRLPTPEPCLNLKSSAWQQLIFTALLASLAGYIIAGIAGTQYGLQ